MSEFTAILSITPCPHKMAFWVRLSSGFRIEVDAMKVFMKYGKEKFLKFKTMDELA